MTKSPLNKYSTIFHKESNFYKTKLEQVQQLEVQQRQQHSKQMTTTIPYRTTMLRGDQQPPKDDDEDDDDHNEDLTQNELLRRLDIEDDIQAIYKLGGYDKSKWSQVTHTPIYNTYPRGGSIKLFIIYGLLIVGPLIYISLVSIPSQIYCFRFAYIIAKSN